MSEKDLILKSLTPRNSSNFSYSKFFTKQQNNPSSFFKTKNQTFTSILNLEENNHDIIQERNKAKYLVVKKLNLKESKNNYYSKAIKKIFYNPKYYLENYYEDKKIIVGKSHQLPIDNNKDSSQLIIRQNKKRKTVTSNKNSSKNSLILLQKSARNSKSSGSYKFYEMEKYTPAESSRSYKTKKDIKKYDITDNDLKLIYKEFAEREKNNQKKKINFFLNHTGAFSINRMVNLQEKILKSKKKKFRFNEKLTDKIMNITFKEKNTILMNQKRDMLVLRTKPIDKELTKFSIFNKTLTDLEKNWVYNLRKNDKKEEQKCLNPSYKELIYYNKVYNKDLFNINFKNNIRKKFLKKINKDNIKKEIDQFDTNSLNSLYIQGKHLLNEEIKISKELVAKKKKLLKYTFNTDEISSILLDESNPIDTLTTPREVNNSMELHNLNNKLL